MTWASSEDGNNFDIWAHLPHKLPSSSYTAQTIFYSPVSLLAFIRTAVETFSLRISWRRTSLRARHSFGYTYWFHVVIYLYPLPYSAHGFSDRS